MPLNDGYGVLGGTIERYFRDPVNDFGQFFHANLEVDAAGERYRCAIDVDSKASAIGVEWRTVGLGSRQLTALTGLGDGFHLLASESSSGAVDDIRSPILRRRRAGIASALLRRLGADLRIAPRWRRGESVDALADLEPLVEVTRTTGLRVLVFGEPFRVGRGVHNIHQNQGDPAGSQWWAENGTWQDGCTILQQSADRWVAFLNKFTSQAYWTDEDGHPA